MNVKTPVTVHDNHSGSSEVADLAGKGQADYVESHDARTDEERAADLLAKYHVDEKALMRKIDMRLIPWLSLLYLLSFLDRTAIGNANTYGLTKDLKMSNTQYLLALTVFFFPYALFEVPSNVLLKRLRPSIWLPGIMVAWGICMVCQGLVHNYGGLVTARFFLGVTEAGLFPGVNYYLSCWYKRREFGVRAAIFFSAATVSGAFGGLLAAAIHNMEGVGGKHSWAWIFILEGLATIVIAIMSFWIIADFPDTATFLSAEERAIVVRRLQEDEQFSAAGEGFQWRNVWGSLRDWKTWLGMGMYMGSDMPLYAFSLFLPSIINALGYTATKANLLSVPVYVFACLVTLGVGFAADRMGKRLMFNFIFLSIGMAGYIILIASRNAALSYFGTFLAAAGIYPLIPNTIAIVSNNVEGSYKRSVSLGMVISWGNINGAVSSNVYRANQKPWYPLGHGLVLMYICFGFISSAFYYIFASRENAARDRGERDELIGGEPPADGKNWYPTLAAAKEAKGDNWSGFRYII